MAITSGDSVTFEYTGRLDDGRLFDTSRKAAAEESGLAEAQPDREYDPLTVVIGEGRIIEGLEDALEGREAGDDFTVTVPPEKGYGRWSEENVREFDADEFERMTGGQSIEEGMFIQTQQGGTAEIANVGSDVVEVDFNHELAGETLEFDIEVVDVE